MNMTFTRTDWQRSQLSIEPPRSQIGCVDQELSQLRGFTESYIHRNDEVLSAQIGMRADKQQAPGKRPELAGSGLCPDPKKPRRQGKKSSAPSRHE
jgi:hypothetical protein